MLDQPANKMDLVRHVLPRNDSRHWGSLVIYPQNVHFAFQKKSEKIYILTRRHFITNSGWILKAIFIMILPFIALIVMDAFLPDYFLQLTTGELFAGSNFSMINVLAVILLYYSFIITYVWTNYIVWFQNVYLITNERMIHTEFRLMSGTKVSEAPLDNIIDITQETYGLFPALFNYGNVKVQTATAMKSRFNFKQIPDPSWFRSVLYELVKIRTEGEP